VTGTTDNLAKITSLELPSVDIDGAKTSVEKTVDLTTISMPKGISLVQEEQNIMIKVNISRIKTEEEKAEASATESATEASASTTESTTESESQVTETATEAAAETTENE
jgi:hypothetical protein